MIKGDSHSIGYKKNHEGGALSPAEYVNSFIHVENMFKMKDIKVLNIDNKTIKAVH